MLDFDASPYGAYVWPAFAITALVFAGLIADSLARARRWRTRTERLRRAEGTTQAADAAPVREPTP